MRLNKFLATCGVASRRTADELIKSGQVKVNGKRADIGQVLDLETDKVEVNGKLVHLAKENVVYLLNKPRGVVTTTNDPQGRKTVLDFLPKKPRVFPCGRLDEDTQGLVVLTNDGTLCYQLTHPKFEHQKEYIVHGQAKDPKASFYRLKSGIALPDGPVEIDAIILHKIHHNKLEFSITIHEGRNRVVRRLCAKVGIEVQTLTRTRIGKYLLGDLTPGEYKIVE